MKKLLVFAHTPPPHHGQSYMVQLLLEGLRTRGNIQCYHVNARFSEDLEAIGRVRLRKVWLAFKYALQAISTRLRHGVDSVYYIPASPTRAAIYRDWIIMGLCRPFFRRLIYHWEAAGLGDWMETKARPWERWLCRWLLGRPDLSVVLANLNRRDGEKLQSRMIEVVPNGVPDPCPEGAPTRVRGKSNLTVLFLSLCTREKGLFDAVEAIALANQAGANLKLVVAGGFRDPLEREEFAQRAKGLLLSDGQPAVEYKGFVSGDEKRRLFLESDCFCFPTYYSAESFGIVLIEAMAYALPIVATNWRMIPELLPKGYALLVEPRSPAQLADALVRARKQGGDALREHFLQHFTADHYVAQMEAALLKGMSA